MASGSSASTNTLTALALHLIIPCRVRLMSMPLLPLFVFDGPKRPSVKRGKKVSGNAHWLTTGMKNIIAAYGFEWRTAPGEAEAELAYLNRIGIIDGVLSDDVDNFLFGTTMVIRNPSNRLCGNCAHPVKNADGRDDGNHVVTYRAVDLVSHNDIRLSRALYHNWPPLRRRLPSSWHRLLEAASSLSREELEKWLVTWRNDVREELRTNKSGVGSKKPALAKKIPDDFPDVDILLSYTNPITSETEGKPTREITWEKEPDIGKIAGLCELYFEWGVKDVIVKRFRTVLWPSAVQRILRRGVMEKDEKRRKGLPMSPQKGNTRARNTLKDDYETPIEVDAALDDTEGEDEDEDCGKQKGRGKKPPPDPESHLRIWMPASMVETVELELVEAFEDAEGKKKAASTTQRDSDGDALPVLAPAKKKPTRQKKAVAEQQDNAFPPRLVPMSNIPSASDNPFMESKNPVLAHISRQSSQPGSNKHTKSFDSDSSQSHITKSPRKSTQQTSPRSSRLTTHMGSLSLIQPMRKGTFFLGGEEGGSLLRKPCISSEYHLFSRQQIIYG
ncbi:hypothetical protein DFH29DRAFT_995272 [Suillus ampliporus]|nr:hypothetical protein DFH29DRAFT_995272 [Suillus ampliporus]